MYQYITANQPGVGGGVKGPGPWDLVLIPPENPPENPEELPPLNFRVFPGLIANALASNWEDTYEVPVPHQGKMFFIVRITINSSGNIDSILIRTEPTFNSTAITPVEWGLPTQVDVLFGIIENGVPYRTIRDGDISVSSKIIVTTSNETTEFIPYTNYYTIIINGGENESFANFGGTY